MLSELIQYAKEKRAMPISIPIGAVVLVMGVMRVILDRRSFRRVQRADRHTPPEQSNIQTDPEDTLDEEADGHVFRSKSA